MPLKAVRVCKQKSFFLLNKLHHTFTVSTFFMRFKVPVGGMSRPHTLNPQGLPGGPSLPWEGFSPCQVLLVSLTLGLPIPFSGPHFATCLSGIPPSAPSASETRKHNILPCREVSPPSYYENGRGVHGKSRGICLPSSAPRVLSGEGPRAQWGQSHGGRPDMHLAPPLHACPGTLRGLLTQVSLKAIPSDLAGSPQRKTTQND